MPRKNRRAKYQLRMGNEVLTCALLTRQEVEERNEVGSGYAEKGQVWQLAQVTGVADPRGGRYSKALCQRGEL